LFEVASLERAEDTVQEACLRHLAASVRAAHKIHGFAGGFDAELSSLFDKVRWHLRNVHSALPRGLASIHTVAVPAQVKKHDLMSCR
jgi:hypothetical protein